MQFNRLSSYNYTFSPVVKQVTIVQSKPKYSPFFGLGVSTLPSISATAGLFYGDWGGAFNYQYDYISKKHIIGSMFLIKF